MVKVYVPTWNSGLTLQRCLDSIVKAVPDAEIFVVDRGSTDATRAIALKYGTYVIFMGNLGEARSFICRHACEQDKPFLMVDSDMVLPQDFFRIAKRFLDPKIGAVYGQKLTVAKKVRRYENYVYSAVVLPLVNSGRLDTSCTLFKPEAVRGFVCRLYSYEDYSIGKHIIMETATLILLDVPCKQLGLGNFKQYLVHVRWSGAGTRFMHLSNAWKAFASLFWMPLKSPCKFTTFQVRLHYVFGFLFSKFFLEFRRGD